GQSVAAVVRSSDAVDLAERGGICRHADPGFRDLNPTEQAAQRLLSVALSHLPEPCCGQARPLILSESVEHRTNHHLLEFARRKARDAAGFLGAALQHGLADVIAVPASSLDCMAGTHAIA